MTDAAHDTPRDPALDSCGCCRALTAGTLQPIDNPAGLSAIAYRVGRHGQFREAMLARLSRQDSPGTQRLTSRSPDDFSIALCDAAAAALDVLSFYQERIANENYLRTASERRSVLELARLIGYGCSPGVAATTWLALTLQEVPGAPALAAAPLRLPPGLKVQSVPGQGETPQTFETDAPLEARVEWNAIPLQTREAWQPHLGDTALWLAGVETPVNPGDAILIVGQERCADPGSERWDIRVITGVHQERTHGRTRLEWAEGLGSRFPRVEPAASDVAVYVFRRRAALFGHNAPDPRLLDKSVPSWPHFEIQGAQIDLDAAYPRVLPGSWFALVSNSGPAHRSGLAGYVELYRARTVRFPSRQDYALASPITRLEPDSEENLDLYRQGLRETLVLAQSERLVVAERPLEQPVHGTTLVLAQPLPGLAPGRPLAISGRRARIRLRPSQPPVTLTLATGGTVRICPGDALRLEGPPEEQAGPSWIRLEPEAFQQRIVAASAAPPLRLTVLDRDGQRGTLVVAPAAIELISAAEADGIVSEIAFIDTPPTAVRHGRDHTTLILSAGLIHCYDRQSVRVNANVTRASHGETVQEVLGSGDGRRPGLSFRLRHSPLTHLPSAAAPSGRASTLTLRVNDSLWNETASLHGRGPTERCYQIRNDDDGTSTVLCGDGVEGARLPSGDHNVRATYRHGLGLGGNVAAGALTTLLNRPLGLAAVTNPESASGGTDPEPLEQARVNAPLTVLTLDRAVSEADYRDFARGFASIAKAHALWIPHGPGRGVFLTVAGERGAAVPPGSETHRQLLEALRRYGDPLLRLRLVSYRRAGFRLHLGVGLATAADPLVVLPALEARLRGTFGFAARDFGQGVSIDAVCAVCHGVAGVEAVNVLELHRLDAATAVLQPRLFAALPVASLTALPEAAELLLLDEGPIQLEVMP